MVGAGLRWLRASRWRRYGVIAGLSLVLVLSLATAWRLLHPAPQKQPITLAIAASLSGNGAAGGQEMVQSAQLYINQVNQQGGLQGHPLKLLIFDDQGDRPVAEAIVASPALVVLGHRSSDASLAAAPVYQAANLAAITGTANNEQVTAKYPNYFRLVYTNRDLAGVLSLYAQKVLDLSEASVIYDLDSPNSTLIASLLQETFGRGGRIRHAWGVSATEQQGVPLATITTALKDTQSNRLIFLPISNEALAARVIRGIREAGLTAPILGEQALARPAFAQSLGETSLSDGLYVPSPLLFDSAGVKAQEFVAAYQRAYGQEPSYLGGKFYEATMVAVHALATTPLSLKPADLGRDRQAVLQTLGQLNEPNPALGGLSGSLYFNAERNSDQPVRIGQFWDQQLISAPEQLTTVSYPERLNLRAELAQGHLIPFQDRYFWRQQVVYTGIDLNKLSRIDQRTSSFTADFYLWFRYRGDDAAIKIEFPDAVRNSVDPMEPVYTAAAPLRSRTVDGLQYRLYRVRGEFKNSFDFRDYPFDRQKLQLRFDNPHLSNERLIYVTDTRGLGLPKSAADLQAPFKGLQLWQVEGLAYYQDSYRNTSTQGDPEYFGHPWGLEYPGFGVQIAMQRRALVFLSKNLLPLFLLMLICYTTLYLPHSMFVPRIMGPASMLLSGVVLLLAFNNQLPEVSYTVALEYVFYTYFVLCLIPIFVTGLAAKFERSQRKEWVRSLDLGARITFPVIVIGLITAYALIYGDRLV